MDSDNSVNNTSRYPGLLVHIRSFVYPEYIDIQDCDIFITELTMPSRIHAEDNKRRILRRSDIATALTKSDISDFIDHHLESKGRKIFYVWTRPRLSGS